MDVKKASSMITQKIDQIARDIEREKTENQEQAETPKEKVYYASVAYLQMADDTRQLEELKDKGDYNGLLALAKEYYDGNGMDEQNTYASPLQNRGVVRSVHRTIRPQVLHRYTPLNRKRSV